MRLFSGIQTSGDLHFGNYFGAIKRLIEAQEDHVLFACLVSLHSLTTVFDKESLKKNIINAAAVFLALGLDPEKCYFWIQSDVPEVCELTWYLSNVTSLGLLERSHAYKDKLARGITPNTGLFIYPVLMAADILLYQAEGVPVGKDQKQHVEMARDIAIRFNNVYGKTFTIPEPDICEDMAIIPGIDGAKMSKSYDNYIEIFSEESTLKKKVMSIVTDSTPLEEPKDPDKCTVFTLYKLFASKQEIDEMRKKYQKGGYGYGEAKKTLYKKINAFISPFREKHRELLGRPDTIRDILAFGAKKAREAAVKTMELVRERVGVKY